MKKMCNKLKFPRTVESVKFYKLAQAKKALMTGLAGSNEIPKFETKALEKLIFINALILFPPE